MRLRLRQRRRERQNRAIRCAARHYERTSDDHFEPYPFGAKIFLPKAAGRLEIFLARQRAIQAQEQDDDVW